MENENAFEKDIISLLDEEGNEHELEIIDSLEVDGKEYMAMIPIFENAEENLDDSGELVILRLSEELDEDGDQYLEAIQDEDEYNQVAELFMGRLEEYFDFDEAEEEGSDEA
ncbi:MAG: DUF1292 domain-containing protein [Angelakisella sp.]|nr:DUF1292 domain-containing protein [Angelakisella sp.]